MKLTDLKKGDIFQFGNKPWDAIHRLFCVIKSEDGRFLISFMRITFDGDIEKSKSNSFTWRDKDVQVFVPKFLLSEQRRTKGKPCVPVSNQRSIFPSNLNQINLSTVFCSHNKYWYDFESIN